ncbi:MAG: hypothetical protein QOK39_1814 [Acidimicrobiaceae bacterium]|jgi:hypothetical protein|nr:hypothetical protein [Acidimicrobiaceae bacterium]
MRIAWQPTEPPLRPVAVAGHGTVGDRLAARAGQEERWVLVRFAAWSVVVGDDLPWVDGATYLGQLPGAAEVLVPVHRGPRLHPDLVVKAVRSLRPGSARGQVAVIPDSPDSPDVPDSPDSPDGDRVAVLLLGDCP